MVVRKATLERQRSGVDEEKGTVHDPGPHTGAREDDRVGEALEGATAGEDSNNEECLPKWPWCNNEEAVR